MASKYEPTLRELALETDEEKRLEMAAQIDRDAEELDERWENRDGYAQIEAERDSIAAERDQAIIDRDEWKKKYADRFFDSNEGETNGKTIVDNHEEDIKFESEKHGYDALWNDMED